MKQLDNLVSEELIISLPYDSLVNTKALHVLDKRKYDSKTLGITQIKKFKYIPIDRYLVLNDDLADIVYHKILADSIAMKYTLVIENLTLWDCPKPFFGKQKTFSGYTYLIDKNQQKIKDWQWHIPYKYKKKQNLAENIGTHLDQWLTQQKDSVKNTTRQFPLYPFKYRRVLDSWVDLILLPDGYIINANLTLNFPNDQKKLWIVNSGGMYYRKSRYHESFSIGGLDNHWMYRLNRNLIWRNNLCLRMGINSFNQDKFNYVDYWNVLMLNLGYSSSVEYRPNFYRGLFIGGGVYLNINGLPHMPGKIKIIEPGLLMTIGITLP